MLSPTDSVGKDMMFLDSHFVAFVCLFVREDIITTVSHEWLEQF